MELEKLDGLTVMDKNEKGDTLYLLNNDQIETAFMVLADATEYCLLDWQGQYPTSMAEVSEYDWRLLTEVDF